MNKVILMGRLVRDPESRSVKNSINVCTFTLAVDRRFKNANGEREADFIRVTAWRQQADFVARYFRKGSRMAIVGSLQTRTWDDTDGKRHYETDVVADEIHFADSKRGDEASAPSEYRGAERAQTSEPQNTALPKPEPFNTAGGGFLPGPSDDTSLPFDL